MLPIQPFSQWRALHRRPLFTIVIVVPKRDNRAVPLFVGGHGRPASPWEHCGIGRSPTRAGKPPVAPNARASQRRVLTLVEITLRGDLFLTGGDMAAFFSCGSAEGGEDAAERMADLFGPGQVDQMIRQAIHFCWMALPKDRRNAEELEKQIRRLVDRALEDFREDSEQFKRSK